MYQRVSVHRTWRDAWERYPTEALLTAFRLWQSHRACLAGVVEMPIYSEDRAGAGCQDGGARAQADDARPDSQFPWSVGLCKTGLSENVPLWVRQQSAEYIRYPCVGPA